MCALARANVEFSLAVLCGLTWINGASRGVSRALQVDVSGR